MPIYEFYCYDCHMIFNFLSRKTGVTRAPSCPRCEKPEIQRKPSRFAISRNLQEAGGDDLPDFDEARLMQAMESMAGDIGSLDEDDPRQAAALVRRLYEASGMERSPALDEAIRRMEAGEDPDRIEEEIGDALEEEDPFMQAGRKAFTRVRRELLPPTVDDTLYDL